MILYQKTERSANNFTSKSDQPSRPVWSRPYQQGPFKANIYFSVRLDLIIQYQEEDRNESFDEMCLFCSQKFVGGREACIEFFRHMNNTHQFNIGHPDNMVRPLWPSTLTVHFHCPFWPTNEIFRFLWKNLLKLYDRGWKIFSVWAVQKHSKIAIHWKIIWERNRIEDWTKTIDHLTNFIL